MEFINKEEKMAETKYGKNIITEVIRKKEAPWTPKFGPEDQIPMMFIDNRVMEGAFYVESAWMLPGFAKETRGASHTHDYDEVLGFYGSNPKDPHNLNALAEVHIGGEIHTVTKSCLIFIPKGVPHGPIDFKRIDLPIFHFSCGTSSKYF
jgi:hypothetical protein